MRTRSAAARATLFGRLEAFTMLGLALGSLLVPALIDVGGASTALEGAAALLALTTAGSIAGLYRRGPLAQMWPTGPDRLARTDAYGSDTRVV